MKELKGKQIHKEYLRQDFYEHVQNNGEAIMVSMDHRFFYRP